MEEVKPSSVKSSIHDMYFSACASSLNKRPIGQIVEEAQKKNGTKKKTFKPSTKKMFTNVVSKINTGVKKTKIVTSVH